MNTLDRYLLGRLLRAFLPTFVGLTGLFVVGAASRLLRDQDLSLRQVALALPWAVPTLLPYLLPVAFAAGGALALARLVDQREVLALQGLGVSARTTLLPALVLALPLSGLSLVLAAQVAPAAYRLRRQVAKAVLLQLAGDGEHLSRRFNRLGVSLYARRNGAHGLEGLLLEHQQPDSPESLLVSAQGASIEPAPGGVALALSGVVLTYRPEPSEHLSPAGPVRVTLPRWRQPLQLTGDASTRRRAEGRTSSELLPMADAAPDLRDSAFEAQLELCYRFVLGLAPLLVAACGFPLALRFARRGPLQGTVLGAVGGCCAAFVPLLAARSLAEVTRAPAWLALGLLVPLGLSVALLRRTESA